MCVCVYVCTKVGWEVQRLKRADDDVTSAETIFTMGPKHCNIDQRSMWTTGTVLKNKPHLDTFHECFCISYRRTSQVNKHLRFQQ